MGSSGGHLDDDGLGLLCLHTASVPPLGADTWVHLQIISGLSKAVHRVHVAHVPGRGRKPTPTAAALEAIPGIVTHAADFGQYGEARTGVRGAIGRLGDVFRAVGSLGRLAWIIRRNRISVIHTSDRPRDAMAAVLLGKLTGAQSIVHVHVLFRPWMGRALQWAIRNADARLTVSAFVAESLTEAGVDGRTDVVRNAIQTERWQQTYDRAQIRDELQIAEDAPVIITVCRLFPEKGVAELIQAAADLRQRFPEIRLLVVGRDPGYDQGYQRQLDGLVAELEMEPNVIFAGLRDDVPRMMAAADVFAMPSFEEPFGLVFAEAMASGLPVVALDDGGTKEIVIDGAHGFLSAPGDHQAMVNNLTKLLEDSDLRDVLGTAGRHYSVANFHASRMVSEVAAIYQQLIRKKTSPNEREG